MSKKQTESGEDRLIARYFKPLATHPGAFGLVDDAAAIAPPKGCDIVLKTDGIVGGVHFFPDDPPETTLGATPMYQQLGFSAGIYQTVYSRVTFALEFFRAQWTWLKRAQMIGTDLYVTTPRQTVNFVNVGATLVW